MNLHYHSWKDFKECPKKYFFKYRHKAPPTVPQNDYFKLYGKLMESFFRMFSNVWGHDSPHMDHETIRNKMAVLWDQLESSSIINWNAPFVKMRKEQIVEQACLDTFAIMDSSSKKYFFDTKSEKEIMVVTKDDTNITGRLDFIHTNTENDIFIFDGKGAGKIGRNVSNEQLYFYALLYYLHEKKMPKHLGFFYYKFNVMMPVDLSIDVLNVFRVRLSEDIKKIQSLSDFVASPSHKSCHFCEYANTCSEHALWQSKHKKPSQIQDVGNGNVQEFGF